MCSLFSFGDSNTSGNEALKPDYMLPGESHLKCERKYSVHVNLLHAYNIKMIYN